MRSKCNTFGRLFSNAEYVMIDTLTLCAQDSVDCEFVFIATSFSWFQKIGGTAGMKPKLSLLSASKPHTKRVSPIFLTRPLKDFIKRQLNEHGFYNIRDGRRPRQAWLP